MDVRRQVPRTDVVLARLPDTVTSLRPVLNATGVLLHTNLGRAPLSAAAIDALGAEQDAAVRDAVLACMS